MPGIEIDGYEIEETIGSGGFGTVVRARQVRFGRDVAIKIGHQAISDPDVARRFDRECRALGSVSGHTHIVGVTGAGQLDDGRPWLAMEYHPGGSLADRIEREGPLSWPEVRKVGIALARALGAAHEAGVLHRDLKPDNIMMSKWGEPVLVDFGIARLAGEAATATTSVTASVAYAPPEILSGSPPSPQSDVYSLGATLVGLMMGHSPYDLGPDATMAARIARVITGSIPELSTLGIPSEAVAVFHQALDPDPVRRPQSMDAFADALADAPEEVPSRADGTMALGAIAAPAEPVAPPSTSGPIPPVSASQPPPGPPPSTSGPIPAFTPPAPTPAGGTSRTAVAVAAVAVVVVICGAILVVATRDSASPSSDEFGGATTTVSAGSGTTGEGSNSTTTRVSTTPPSSTDQNLKGLVLASADVPAGYSRSTVGLAGAETATVCDRFPLSNAIVDQISSEYATTDDENELVSEVIEFSGADGARAWMKLFAALPDQCDSWDVENADGSTSTWTAKTTNAGQPFNSGQVRLEARTDNFGCLVNAFPRGKYVGRVTLCGSGSVDDGVLDRLTNLVGDRIS